MTRYPKFRCYRDGKMYHSDSQEDANLLGARLGQSLIANFMKYFWGDENLSQFTGLFDNNYNDIFEGDIIKYRQRLFNTNPLKFPYKIKVVKWNGRTLAWNIFETSAGEEDITIIGNIYQTPELIPNENL